MTSNPRFAQYVDRVQEYLALFSIADESSRDIRKKNVTRSQTTAKVLVFEILFNYQFSEDQPISSQV
jgi:hypothetical protein